MEYHKKKKLFSYLENIYSNMEWAVPRKMSEDENVLLKTTLENVYEKLELEKYEDSPVVLDYEEKDDLKELSKKQQFCYSACFRMLNEKRYGSAFYQIADFVKKSRTTTKTLSLTEKRAIKTMINEFSKTH
jgi:shikimate kinase